MFDPDVLPGISFYSDSHHCWIRYIYPDAKHFCAGWLLAIGPSGEWNALHRATDEDLTAIRQAVVRSHHEKS